MAHDFSNFKRLSQATIDWLKKEYSGIRTGRANPGILDGISVNAYGSSQPLHQLANVSIEDPKTLRVTVWDKEVAKDIDKAVRESNLGLSVSIDDAGLRVSFPELTSERRSLLSKLAKEKSEEARIAIRTEREKNQQAIEKKEKEGSLSKDDKFRLKDELQKLVDEANRQLEELAVKKEKEILE